MEPKWSLSSPKILTIPSKSSKKQEKAAKIEPNFKKGLTFLRKYSIIIIYSKGQPTKGSG